MFTIADKVGHGIAYFATTLSFLFAAVLSHVHEARAEVTFLANALESHGCSCFVAHVQIEPSQDWRLVIERALGTCHTLVAHVTPDFHASNWTDQEVGWILGQRAARDADQRRRSAVRVRRCHPSHPGWRVRDVDPWDTRCSARSC